MKQVDIYIDTSIKGPRRRHGSYIYKVAMTCANGKMADVGGMEVLENTTENSSTVQALETALGRLTRPCHLTIWLNCSYVAAVLNNKWYEQWAKTEWINKKGEAINDAENWKKITELIGQHEYEVRLKEHHQFSDWMSWTLKEKE